jgi:hypothetical protein
MPTLRGGQKKHDRGGHTHGDRSGGQLPRVVRLPAGDPTAPIVILTRDIQREHEGRYGDDASLHECGDAPTSDAKADGSSQANSSDGDEWLSPDEIPHRIPSLVRRSLLCEVLVVRTGIEWATFRRVRGAIGDENTIDPDEHALGITLDVLERRSLPE